MKKTILCACLVVGIVVACTTSQQRVSFNTVVTVSQTAASSYDGYLKLVLGGTVSTNALPKVSKIYNQVQADCAVLMDAAYFNTNALAPASLTTELSDLQTAILTATGGK